MNKRIWIIGTFGTGVVLCIFGNAAFAVVGVLLGLASVAAGIFFISGYKKASLSGFSQFFASPFGSSRHSSNPSAHSPEHSSHAPHSSAYSHSSLRRAAHSSSHPPSPRRLGVLGLIASIKGGAIIVGVGLIVLGVLLIILCIFVEAVAFFLGGIITLAAGIILLPLCGKHHRLIVPFCIACMAVGAFMLFAPSFIWWISVALGVGLIVFSGLIVICMD